MAYLLLAVATVERVLLLLLLFIVHDDLVRLRQLVHRIVVAQLMGLQLLALHVESHGLGRFVGALGDLTASVSISSLNKLHLLVLR